jgi:hypothetical protein
MNRDVGNNERNRRRKILTEKERKKNKKGRRKKKIKIFKERRTNIIFNIQFIHPIFYFLIFSSKMNDGRRITNNKIKKRNRRRKYIRIKSHHIF